MSTPSAYAPAQMDCTDLHRELAAGVPSGPEVDAHLAVCPPCSALLADDCAVASALDTLRDGRDDLDALKGRTLAAVADDRGPRGFMAKTPTWVHSTALLGAVIAIALSQIMALRADFDAYPTALMVLVLAAFTGPLIGLTLGATRPVHQAPLSRAIQSGLWLTALAIPLVVAAMPAPHTHPASDIAGAFGQATFACFAFGAAITVGILVLHKLFDRRSHADRDSTILAALIGALAGAIALQLHCPFSNNAHQALGHASQGVLFAGLIFTWFSARQSR